jgi:hypothetical protein
MQAWRFMAHIFILSLEADKTFCLVVLNSHTSLHRRHPPLSRSTVLNLFWTPPLDLSTFNGGGGGGGGGSEKWFSPASVPPNVARPQHFRPPPSYFHLPPTPPSEIFQTKTRYHSPHPATVILSLHAICPTLHTR